MSVTATGEAWSGSPPLVPARMLNEFAYCPRLAYLEWVQGEFRDNVDTLEGRLDHRRVDDERGDVPGPESLSDTETGDGIRACSLLLSSTELGCIARIDLLEMEGGTVTPVDYKHGEVPNNRQKSWEPDRVQLCLQGLILRENGYRCTEGVIYYIASKTRVTIPFDETLVSRTLALLRDLKEMAQNGQIPAPLLDSPKCDGCSLAAICLPDEVNFLAGISGETVDTPRRLVPALSDQMPVYVQEQGAFISKRGDLMVIKQDGQVVAETRLLSVSQLCVFGNVQVSTQMVRELASRGIPICYFTYGGWFACNVSSTLHNNVDLRARQYAIAADDAKRLRIASQFVSAKIRNCRTMLRRNYPHLAPAVLAELKRLAQKAETVRDPESLLGVEGAAARIYFSNFGGMLKGTFGSKFDFESRNRRPPRDPVNALLSFVYTLLIKDLYVTLLAVGFDPLMGFFHRPKFGKPALALDLAEEFRPLVGDSVVLTVLNGGEITADDFIVRGGSVALKPQARRKLIAAYERRLNMTIRHPVFGYSISYRRVFEVQARLLSRNVLGEIPDYPAFTTR